MLTNKKKRETKAKRSEEHANDDLAFFGGTGDWRRYRLFYELYSCENAVSSKKSCKNRKIHIAIYTRNYSQRKNLLARAIGETVAEKVFTKEDIKEIFLSEKMKKTVAESVWQVIYGKEGEQTASDLLLVL